MSDDADDSPVTTPAEGYDALAERADDVEGTGSPWGDNPYQAHYSWPATRALLPGLEGRRVLDAGCGVGDHVGWLLDEGAAVVGVDASEAALETARERFGDVATFHHADLAEPLDCLAEDSVDVVLSHLALDHVADLSRPFASFRRVLAPGGTLAFAVVHPMRLYEQYGDAIPNYYETTAVEVPWPGVTFPSYYRPPGTVLDALLDAGFVLEAFEEPKPRPEYAEHAPERYEAATERPGVLCVRARAPDG